MVYQQSGIHKKKQHRFIAVLLLLLAFCLVFGVIHYSPPFLRWFSNFAFIEAKGPSLTEAIFERDDPRLTLNKDPISQQQQTRTYSHKVEGGETLSDIFSLYGLDKHDLLLMIKARPQGVVLRDGQIIEWVYGDSNQLLSLHIHRNATVSSAYIKSHDNFVFQPNMTSAIKKSSIITSKVKRNFYQSARIAGLSPKQINTIATALYWQVDVTDSDVIGDQFAVVVERNLFGQQVVGEGKVVAVLYQHKNEYIELTRFNDDNFYTPDGVGVQRPLGRMPLRKKYPISSHFNPNRRHPFTHQYAPHYGTDFATPIGTPVFSPGDGRVEKVGYHPLAGRYIVMSHGRVYSTHYFHLSQELVRVGDRVKRNQKIGLTGNTGRSTGPHLHFELRQNGLPMDAMLSPLPQQKKLTSAQYQDFHELVKRYIPLLYQQF